MSGRGMRSGQP